MKRLRQRLRETQRDNRTLDTARRDLESKNRDLTARIRELESRNSLLNVTLNKRARLLRRRRELPILHMKLVRDRMRSMIAEMAALRDCTKGIEEYMEEDPESDDGHRTSTTETATE